MENVQTAEAPLDETDKIYREKILRTLRTYPEISPSMLHIGIGPSAPTALWKPVLEAMIEEGIVERYLKLVDGKTYTVLRIPVTVPAAPEHTLKTV